MFAALSFIFGGLFRLFPEVMRLWDKQKDRQHELDMLAAQTKADEARSKIEMQTAEVKGNIALNIEEMKAIVAASQDQAKPFEKTGYWFLDGVLVIAEVASSLVRPVLTYWYCIGMYGTYKAASLRLLMQSGAEWDQAIPYLWTEADQNVMSSILGFWFVDRSLRKMGVKPA